MTQICRRDALKLAVVSSVLCLPEEAVATGDSRADQDKAKMVDAIMSRIELRKNNAKPGKVAECLTKSQVEARVNQDQPFICEFEGDSPVAPGGIKKLHLDLCNPGGYHYRLALSVLPAVSLGKPPDLIPPTANGWPCISTPRFEMKGGTSLLPSYKELDVFYPIPKDAVVLFNAYYLSVVLWYADQFSPKYYHHVTSITEMK